MKEILNELSAWVERGDEIALATVINTWGSSPRAPGAKLAINQDGEMCGSVSGGCVEGAAIEEGLGVLAGSQAKLLHFGVADESAWEVGLACGGSIDVFVEPLDVELFPLLKEQITKDQAALRALVVRGPDALLGAQAFIPVQGEPAGNLLGAPWWPDVRGDARRLLDSQASFTLRQYEDPAAEVFFDLQRPAPQLIVVGGVHIAIELFHFARPLNFRTYLVDPRRAFATRERFPHVDVMVRQWPDKGLQEIGLHTESSVVVVTHDPKLDDPALMVALPSPARYVGALGGLKTHSQRVERLLEAGLTQEQMQRLHAPIGLDIGGRTPAEIALSIMAEIVAVRNGRTELKGI